MQGVKGGRLSLTEPRGGRSSSTQQASVEMDFLILFSASACLCVCLFACVMCVCAFRLVNQVYRDHVKGWSAMAVTRLFSFFVVFFLIFPFIFDQGFVVSLPPPPQFDAPRYTGAGYLQRVHTSSALRVFSSRLLLAGVPAVSQNDADAASEGWRRGFARPTKAEA